MEIKKQYGLIQKKTTVNIKKPVIFNESDDEEESNVDWVKKALQKETYGGGGLTRQSRANIQKILKEDPTTYQYDEIYDKIKMKETEAKEIKKSDRKPKYMQLLLAQSEKRKKEDERRKERQIQKERETEGDQFADKESFVTSAYKKKLEEMKKLDEEEQRENMLEEIGDVRKQCDLSGFYRHLYEKEFDDQMKSEPKKLNDEEKKTKQSTEEKNTVNRVFPEEQKKDERKEKQIQGNRKTVDDQSEDKESGITSVQKNKPEKMKKLDEEQKENMLKEIEDVTEQYDRSGSDQHIYEKESEKPIKSEPEQSDEEKKPNRSIWEKRTIDDVFDAALERYYKRKTNGLSVPVA